MSFIAQFSKFCAKVIHFLHIPKKNVQFFAKLLKFLFYREKFDILGENKLNFILSFERIVVPLHPIS